MAGQRWIAAAVAVVAAAGITAACDGGAAGDATAAKHRVTYRLTGVGEANQPIRIMYSGPGGETLETSVPSFLPEWTRSVTVQPGIPMITLNAGAPWTDTRYQLTCVMEVDGVEVARNVGPFCETWFKIADLPEVLASTDATPEG